MISIEEAFKAIDSIDIQQNILSKSCKEVNGHVCGENPISPINMPPFNQSAMDGYAICGLNEIEKFDVVGEIKAGDDASKLNLEKGQAYRIFTGAMVPKNSDCVVQQEITRMEDDKLTLTSNSKENANIRFQGEQIQKGNSIELKGKKLTPETISYLTTLGITQVSVYTKAKVGVLVTGDELLQAGEELIPGKIYESNGILIDLLCQPFSSHINSTKVKDDFNSTKNSLKTLIKENDVLVITGGISVGDYDFVGKALKELGVETLFYKVKQKPGKPIFVGRFGEKTIFALPGNPAAAATCFHLYVKPFLKRFMGQSENLRPTETGFISHEYFKKGDRPQFLKAQISEGGISVLNKQSSAMLGAFSDSNCFAFAPGDKNEFKQGDKMTAYLI